MCRYGPRPQRVLTASVDGTIAMWAVGVADMRDTNGESGHTFHCSRHMSSYTSLRALSMGHMHGHQPKDSQSAVMWTRQHVTMWAMTTAVCRCGQFLGGINAG